MLSLVLNYIHVIFLTSRTPKRFVSPVFLYKQLRSRMYEFLCRQLTHQNIALISRGATRLGGVDYHLEGVSHLPLGVACHLIGASGDPKNTQVL